LGINSLGKPGFKIATQNGWVDVEGSESLPLFKWAHLAGTYDGESIILYLDGERIASKEVPSV